ncbi:ABC transporter permease [Nostoc sp. CHAB 5784]|uniref:ABC transporter permease n=1 Tax=Nostoc mirabile TaxID=2907820 RepID=UPI001E609C16|nr:ABC transporter permease [Nostoc mirabile]MCC5670748.1 ABC transporter permease [Nostoc mirabile CHAB5784]
MVRPKRVIAQTIKELVQLKRDQLILALAFLLPVFAMLLFGLTSSLDVNNINLAVQDLDITYTSREYIATFERTNKFKIVAIGSKVNVPQMLNQGKIAAGLIIPPEFTRDLRHGREAQVQILVDGTDANTANLIRNYAIATNNAFVGNLNHKTAIAVNIQSQFWYNPGLKSLNYVGPGAMGMSLTLLPPLFAGLATAKEWEHGTIIQVYASSLTGTEYLLGKTMAYWLVGITEVFLTNVMAWFFFGLWYAGDPTPLIVGSALYVACGVLWGIFVGSNFKSLPVVVQVVVATTFMLPWLMSGFTYPIANIPTALRWLANFTPTTFYILLARDAFSQGMGWSIAWSSVLTLGLLAGFFFLLAWWKLRRMQLED